MPAPEEFPFKGDTVVGNDVWIGYDSLIMPGVHIGNGSIVSSRSVVVSQVPAYTVVGGNPARALRTRFEPEVIAELERIACGTGPWRRSPFHLRAIMGADLDALRAARGEGTAGW